MVTCITVRMTLYAACMEMTFKIMFAAGSTYRLVIKHSHKTSEVYLLKFLHTCGWYSYLLVSLFVCVMNIYITLCIIYECWMMRPCGALCLGAGSCEQSLQGSDSHTGHLRTHVLIPFHCIARILTAHIPNTANTFRHESPCIDESHNLIPVQWLNNIYIMYNNSKCHVIIFSL